MKNKSRLTINDVAFKAGVSKSTVSLVIQGSPLVKPETRKAVEEAMVEIGYVYNRGAANFRNRSSNIIGLIIHDLTNPFFSEMCVGLEKELANSGYIVFLSNTSEDPKIQLRNFNAMKEHRAAGFVICPALGTDDNFVESLKNQDSPVVSVIRPLPNNDCFDLVTPDVFQGTYLATKHLYEQGYRRIAFVGGLDSVIRKKRIDGYRKALSELNLTYNPDLIVDFSPSRENGDTAIRELIAEQKDQVDSCVCYNDLVAFGALWGLHDLGVSVGQRFGVVGFDNIAATSHTTPPLTTIATDPQEIGRATAELLLQRIKGSQTKVVDLVQPIDLIVRNSSGRKSESNR